MKRQNVFGALALVGVVAAAGWIFAPSSPRLLAVDVELDGPTKIVRLEPGRHVRIRSLRLTAEPAGALELEDAQGRVLGVFLVADTSTSDPAVDRAIDELRTVHGSIVARWLHGGADLTPGDAEAAVGKRAMPEGGRAHVRGEIVLEDLND